MFFLAQFSSVCVSDFPLRVFHDPVIPHFNRFILSGNWILSLFKVAPRPIFP